MHIFVKVGTLIPHPTGQQKLRLYSSLKTIGPKCKKVCIHLYTY